jgi:hypothetical protein
MQSGLGHLVVYYMVMNVLEEHSGSVFTGSRKIESVCPDRILGTHQSDYTVLNPNILHFPCFILLLHNN